MAVVTATITSEGIEMEGRYELLSIDVSKEFNKVPTAELRLIDGIVSQQKFDILDERFFDPGKRIEIALRYENEPQNEDTVFIGIVVNQSLELNKFGTTLTIELSDEAIKMTNARKNAVYIGEKDSVIIEKQIKQNGLKGTMTETVVTHPQMIQYYATDWDFMVSRAEVNAQLVSVNNGEIAVFKPTIQVPSFELELGQKEIYDFDLKVNAGNQYHEVNAVAWDSSKQTLTTPDKGDEYKVPQGDYDISKIAPTVGAEETTLIHAATMDTEELKAWSDSQMLKSRLSFFRGWFKIVGTPKIQVGQTIAIKGVSKSFTGENIITGVRHEVTPEGWITHLQIGMDPCWFAAQSNVTDTKAAGLLPGVNGLQIGIVKAHKEDPKHPFQVRVMIPALGPDKDTVWARLATIDGGVERGMLFRPEPEDEVIVGFLNDDPRQAIILGSMHSAKNKAPLPFDEKNSQKGIFTKSKYQLLFDEGKEVITLSTSEKNQISIDEKQKIIKMSDANGNHVELNTNGVMIISAKDCQIKAEGNFNIEAEGNVSIKGSKVDLI
ncbi:type VI secretion system tip protein VgrG [Aquimarina sp. AD10]|uniref:type VI secretion system tip protein VgrG n=1 Tax=Aquimarina sp. AD10 TaxID=1714849 RepID=UPI000E47EB46|nr:type VI secretion system tip protein VgrG [Aquimarina sp. AD10]AXT61399.1 type VI secretion system tip protein VgrG [Aquimarina sp. AD10]RKN01407.1 type VI secretion system tip protein VgrG [Aquimarina sp. AD10]